MPTTARLTDENAPLIMEHIGNDLREGQTTKTQTNPERELKDAYDAAAAEYKDHLARAHSLGPLP